MTRPFAGTNMSTDYTDYQNRRNLNDRLVKLPNNKIVSIAIRISTRMEQPILPITQQKYFEWLEELISEAEGNPKQQQTIDFSPLTAVDRTLEILNTKKPVVSVREKLDNGFNFS